LEARVIIQSYNQHIGSFLPSLFWLVCTTKVYSGVGADIVMESFTLRTPQRVISGFSDSYFNLLPLTAVMSLTKLTFDTVSSVLPHEGLVDDGSHEMGTVCQFLPVSSVSSVLDAINWLSCSFKAALNPRIPSPNPFPSSGSFFGPNTSKAMPKITRRCMGWNNPSNIVISKQYGRSCGGRRDLHKVNLAPSSRNYPWLTISQRSRRAASASEARSCKNSMNSLD